MVFGESGSHQLGVWGSAVSSPSGPAAAGAVHSQGSMLELEQCVWKANVEKSCSNTCTLTVWKIGGRTCLFTGIVQRSRGIALHFLVITY